jgi:hypothetical protein
LVQELHNEWRAEILWKEGWGEHRLELMQSLEKQKLYQGYWEIKVKQNDRKLKPTNKSILRMILGFEESTDFCGNKGLTTNFNGFVLL